MMRLSAAIATVGLALLLWSVVPAGTDAPAMASSTPTASVSADAARGKALFLAKGCATCHINKRAVEDPGPCCAGVGPELTNYTNDPAFLRRWLADPPAVRPGTQMPKLNLSPAEIEQMVAFLNEPR